MELKVEEVEEVEEVSSVLATGLVPLVAQPVSHNAPVRQATCKSFIRSCFSMHAVPQKRRRRRSGRLKDQSHVLLR